MGGNIRYIYQNIQKNFNVFYEMGVHVPLQKKTGVDWSVSMLSTSIGLFTGI